MIYLSGSINTCSQADLQREANLYAQNGWELKNPTTHKVTITLDEADIEAFCNYLRSRPFPKTRTWTDRNGQERVSQTVSFYLNGSEMTGSWTSLRARINPAASSSPAPAAPRPAAPRPTRPQTAPAPAASAPAPAAAWGQQTTSDDLDDDDIPF